MNLSIENILLVGSLLLIISIIAGKASFRFGVPILVLFLGVGMLAGSEGIGGIRFSDFRIAQFIGIVSLNVILFSGGLDTDWKAVKPIMWMGFSLSTLGVLLTAVTLGMFVYWLTDFTIYEALLLGSIVSSTDAAAVFSILRSKKLALKSNLRPTLEFESGSNDPMAYVLTISFLSLIVYPDMSFWTVIPLFLKQMFLGAVLGLFFGWLSKTVINKISLDYEGLYPVLVMALMFVIFSATDYVGGNGFLAVYISGVYVGNHELLHKKAILKSFDGMAWLMQIVLFLTLGLLVVPSQIVEVSGIGMLIALFLILVARPVSVFISLIPFKMKLRRRLYISWVGLRGAVPIVFATYPLLAGIAKADMIFNIVFFISLTSVLIQGSTISLFAKWFRVALPYKVKKRSAVDLFMTEYAANQMVEIDVPASSFPVGRKIVDLDFPKNSSIALINRNKAFFSPQGSTIIQEDDRLIILFENQKSLSEVYDSLKIQPDD